MTFSKVSILGVGLLGASFSLALKKNGICGHITGCGRSRENLERAQAAGIIDSVAPDPAAACIEADLVLLASPVGSFVDLVKKSAPALRPGAIVTDVGSVKGDLVCAIEKMMPRGVHFIGSHPIAGSDRSGIAYASADLFAEALCIVTPTEGSDAGALETVRNLWKRFGSKVLAMDPALHDRTYAAVSHLPHLIAYVLVNTVADIDRSFFSFCGQGFRDTTRIAASSPEIWTDISLLNRENLIGMITTFRENLDRIEQSLKDADAGTLRQELIRASRTREQIGQD